METPVTAPKSAAKICAHANLLGNSDFLIRQRCYAHCIERCTRVPFQRPRKPMQRRGAACEQACRLVPKLPPISKLAGSRIERRPSLERVARRSDTVRNGRLEGNSSSYVYRSTALATPGLSPSTANVGSARRTGELSRTTCARSIVARQTAHRMSVRTCRALRALASYRWILP
jgi:hypothetical protein